MTEYHSIPESAFKDQEGESDQWISTDLIYVAEDQKKKVDRKKVEKHRADFEEGRDILPIDVIPMEINGQIRYRILGNGRHRYFGALEAGVDIIPVRIHDSRLSENENAA